MRLELESVGVWSVIKVGFLINLIFGIIAGIFVALFMVPMMAFMSTMSPTGVEGFDPGEFSPLVMLIIFPIIYGVGNAVFGTIIMAIMAVVYNLVARLLGGIEYDVVVQDAEGFPWPEQAAPQAYAHPQAAYGPPPGAPPGYGYPPQQPAPQAPQQPPPPPPAREPEPPATPPEPPPAPPSGDREPPVPPDARPGDHEKDKPEG